MLGLGFDLRRQILEGDGHDFLAVGAHALKGGHVHKAGGKGAEGAHKVTVVLGGILVFILLGLVFVLVFVVILVLVVVVFLFLVLVVKAEVGTGWPGDVPKSKRREDLFK